MTRTFEYNGLPAHVIFGYDTLENVRTEVEKLGVKRTIVLTTPEFKEKGNQVSELLGSTSAGVYPFAKMHTPVDVTEDAMRFFQHQKADGTVAIGGGSTIGLGKAIALRTDCPQLVIPTTYAGSEMSPYLGQTENGVKTTISSRKVLPETVIYDVALTHTLPARFAAASGINAIAHAAEALYAKNTNPVVNLMAAEGISVLREALPKVVQNSEDREGRFNALYGAWLCSIVQGQVSMALHHKICHALGGSFNLPHADIHANVLPHAIAYNSKAAATAVETIATSIGDQNAALGLFKFNREIGVYTSLKDLGMPESGIEVIVDQIMNTPYWNPRKMNRDALIKLLQRVWTGEPPKYDPD
jgi:maleylacetate reductase